MQERDQKRDSAKNIFWKYFVMSQTKKDLKILLEQLHWLPLGEVVNFWSIWTQAVCPGLLCPFRCRISSHLPPQPVRAGG